MAKSFRIGIAEEILGKIRQRVADYDWHEMPAHGGWAYGTNLPYLKSLCDYWVSGYDWRREEAKLNRFPQYTSSVALDGETLELHYYHVPAARREAPALLLSHGWPGSIAEFLDVIEPLSAPERHGGAEADAFHVIVPSLPGYGFSGKPKNPISPRRIARYFARLMAEELGYRDYIAQGGDWGSAISGWLAHDDANCRGAHLNMYGWRLLGDQPQTEEEKKFAAAGAAHFDQEGAYFRLQMTKPQTLSYAMMDSPVGTAAWIIEKFKTWSDLKGDNPESVYTKDQLLTNVMIYLVTRSFNTAAWLYRGLFEDAGGKDLPPMRRIAKPIGVANFPKDFLGWPPRSQVERQMNVVHWTEMGEGGHFAAMEKPVKFVADIRKFARTIR